MKKKKAKGPRTREFTGIVFLALLHKSIEAVLREYGYEFFPDPIYPHNMLVIRGRKLAASELVMSGVRPYLLIWHRAENLTAMRQFMRSSFEDDIQYQKGIVRHHGYRTKPAANSISVLT